MGGVEERPAKGFRASGKAMEEARRYRQSLLGFPYAHEGLGNRHTAAASRKQAACQGDTCRMCFSIEIFVMDTVPPLLTSREEPV